MTHLTYTVAHIIVGAEKPYVEALGRVAINLEDIEVKYLRTFNGFTRERKKILKQNLSHPLSELAKKLGAIVYGGFEDEKDFHLLLPTFEGLKVGDVAMHYYMTKGESHVGLETLYIKFTISSEEYKTPYFVWAGKDRWGSFPNITDEYKIKGNIFQEYARTGIMENNLYKQFFK